ncbi:MAG: selenium metabolism-associated LysR family transcriptional regulator [Deltaproteobacteria bacterium]|nr:selenium metabolism-associated LysR family transcriptional regulator [Deltaproteobacteria bacterium]
MANNRFKSITIQQMEAIISLVEERSFSRAAKRMLLTQPALTKNIKNAEDYIGVRLVNRSSAGISLTPEGKIIYDYAQRMVKLRDEAKTKIIKLHENTGGNIYIGASTIPATYILPRALSAFSKTNPDIRIYIKTADSEEAMNMVLDNEVEIGCIGKKPLNKKLTAEPLWKDRLVLIVPKLHPWRKKKSIMLPELLNEHFVIREKGSATRELFESCLKESKSISLSQFNIRGELGSSEAIKEAVIAGLGVSVISVHAVEREMSQGLLFEVPIQGCPMERNFYLIYKSQFDFRPSHKIFIRFIKNYMPDKD